MISSSFVVECVGQTLQSHLRRRLAAEGLHHVLPAAAVFSFAKVFAALSRFLFDLSRGERKGTRLVRISVRLGDK